MYVANHGKSATMYYITHTRYLQHFRFNNMGETMRHTVNKMFKDVN